MYVRRETVAMTTATGGGATAASLPMNGKVASIQYVPTTGAVLASTADFAITNMETGEVIWTEANITAAKIVRPTRAGHTTAGATASGANGVYLCNDRVKFVIAQGGNTKQATFKVSVI